MLSLNQQQVDHHGIGGGIAGGGGGGNDDNNDQEEMDLDSSTGKGSNGNHHHTKSHFNKDNGSNGHNNDNGRDGNGTRTTMMTREEQEAHDQRVFALRIVVIFLLLCAGIAISVIVYLITQGHQASNLEADYSAAASKVTDTFLDIALDKLGAAGSLVVAMVAHGVDHTERWPFVTLSSFQQRSASVKQSSGALSISFNPIVYPQDREQWENYTLNSEYAVWYQQGLSFQKGLGLQDLDVMPQVETKDPNLDVATGVANRIFNFVNDTTNEAYITPEEERYLPTWEMSPVSKRTLVNENIAASSLSSSSSSSSITAITALEKRAVVLDGPQRAPPGYADDEGVSPQTSMISFLLSYADGERTKYLGDVFTNVYFPIYSDFTVSRYTVGIMRIVIHWARYFKNVLPADTVGILFVLDNSCDEPYSYMINGEDVVLLGPGDLHDGKFDHTMRQVSFNEAETIADGTKHGLALFNGDCPYSVRVYQTQEFQNRYYTRTPVAITISVAIVFFFTVLLFLVYNRSNRTAADSEGEGDPWLIDGCVSLCHQTGRGRKGRASVGVASSRKPEQSGSNNSGRSERV